MSVSDIAQLMIQVNIIDDLVNLLDNLIDSNDVKNKLYKTL